MKILALNAGSSTLKGRYDELPPRGVPVEAPAPLWRLPSVTRVSETHGGTSMPNRSLLCCFTLLISAAAVASASPSTQRLTAPGAPPDMVSESLRREAAAAMDRATDWLRRHQQADGNWSNREFPALTALPVWALIVSGHQDTPAVQRGIEYILSCVHEDGSIWVEPAKERKGGGLKNYNTALSMVALHLTGEPALQPIVRRARAFVARGQHLGGDEYHGGMGYDAETNRAYADLSNSYVAYEAMRLTEELKDLRGQHPHADLDWAAAEQFVASLQNPDGGFIYKPGHSNAGADTNETGEVAFRSYGSMTYAGLLSLIYADVSAEDPRVQSAFDWAARHWDLAENPGMGPEGLYYFYNVLTKALAAYGEEVLPTEPQPVHWRTELIRKLLNLQRIEPDGTGYWQNDVGRWMESDPVLVTAYSLIALAVALGT